MADTSASIALRLSEWMDENKVPFPEGYEIQPTDTVPPNDLMRDYFDPPAQSYMVDDPAVDAKGGSGSWPSNIVPDTWIAADLAGIGFLVQSGVSLKEISIAVNANPYLILSGLYPASPGHMEEALKTASTNVIKQLAPTNGKVQNDLFGVFGVVYPVIKSVYEQCADVCAQAYGVTPTPEQYAAAVAGCARVIHPPA